jgi:hypothetical protein
LIIGLSNSGLQALSSAVKLPALYMITLVICLPTLYFFDILFGSALTFGQYSALLMSAVAVMSVLLFSFAPVTLFFLISIQDYLGFQLINVCIFAFTGLIGIKVFYEAMRSIAYTTVTNTPAIAAVPEGEPSDVMVVQSAIAPAAAGLQKTRLRLLQAWLILYGLVGSQLGWTLRPFFGAPSEPFQLFRSLESNFYAQVWRSILTVLGL